MEKLWDSVLNSLEHDAVVWAGVVLLFLLTFAASRNQQPGWLDFKPRGYNRGKRMLRRARQQFVDSLLTDDFTDRIETRVYHGEITRSEATEVYRRLKRLFPVRNIFPSPEALKDKIRNRLGKHVTPNLPDASVKARPKNLFDNSPKRVTL